MTIVDNAVYVDGRRTDTPKNLDEMYEMLRDRSGMAWIGLYLPGLEELRSVAEEFCLHELAVEDALNGHQRA
jgi:magnesium transporter